MPTKRTATLTWYSFTEKKPHEEWKIFVKHKYNDDASMYPGWVHNGKLVSPEYSFEPVDIQPDWYWFYASDLDGGYLKKFDVVDYVGVLVPTTGMPHEYDDKTYDALKEIANGNK